MNIAYIYILSTLVILFLTFTGTTRIILVTIHSTITISKKNMAKIIIRHIIMIKSGSFVVRISTISVIFSGTNSCYKVLSFIVSYLLLLLLVVQISMVKKYTTHCSLIASNVCSDEINISDIIGSILC